MELRGGLSDYPELKEQGLDQEKQVLFYQEISLNLEAKGSISKELGSYAAEPHGLCDPYLCEISLTKASSLLFHVHPEGP